MYEGVGIVQYIVKGTEGLWIELREYPLTALRLALSIEKVDLGELWLLALVRFGWADYVVNLSIDAKGVNTIALIGKLSIYIHAKGAEGHGLIILAYIQPKRRILTPQVKQLLWHGGQGR
jgi:hypothetical protein